MSYDTLTAWLAAIETHAIAAGAALTPTLDDVAIGLPVPRGRCVRIHWDGEQQPARMGASRDLKGELIAERIRVVCYWPLSTNSEDQGKQIVREMYEFKHELRTRVLGDSQLGGMSTDLEMEYVNPDFVLWADGTVWAQAETAFVTDYTEYPLAP